jgi:hypothetical protein
MNIKLVIPTFKRLKAQDTLDYLEAIKFPKDMIYLFVQDKKEEVFHLKNNGHRVSKVVFGKANNLTEQLNNILSYFDKGDLIVKMDDDIKQLSYLQAGKLVKITDGGVLVSFFLHAFKTTMTNNTVIWGVYPVHNAFYMKDGYSTWALVMGTCMGIINNGERFDEHFILKQDYDLSCRVLKKYGKVVRFNSIASDGKHFDNPGGCKEYRDKYYDGIFKLFMKVHGDIVQANPKRKNEILLRKK